MKVCIVGPGILPIPPKGWGAVEILIHDYRVNLEELGHEVEIVNCKNPNMIVGLVNFLCPDFVHIQYDEFINVVPHLECKNIAITSHYGYLEQPNRWDPGYNDIFWNFVNSTANIFCLSPGIAEVYRKANIPDSRLHVVPNGVRNDLFNFEEFCEYSDRSMYLAKVDFRKRQHLFQNIKELYFAGNLADDRFMLEGDRYLGEWSKIHLYENLTNYANLALLSDGEAHPLVCLEAMSAGLGLVISQYSAANLDTDLPFIDVIPEEKISDVEYVSQVLEKNRKVSIKMRKEIRKYATTFSWFNMVENVYLPTVNKVVESYMKPLTFNLTS
jgi:hypothetical protein